jgi:hypothetical protein
VPCLRGQQVLLGERLLKKIIGHLVPNFGTSSGRYLVSFSALL